MSTRSVPTLYEWAGGIAALERLTHHFYGRVRDDEMLSPIFAQMHADHPRFVAQFLAEVFGGPSMYSAERGGHAHMVSRHLNRQLTEAQRKRWMAMLLESADAVGLPDDPEFRSALVSYIEWGSRVAVINSKTGEGGRVQYADAAVGMGRSPWSVSAVSELVGAPFTYPI